jgi:hypothetical protein
MIIDRDGDLVSHGFHVDVAADVATWNHDGTAAAKTMFSWICTIEAARKAPLGG